MLSRVAAILLSVVVFAGLFSPVVSITVNGGQGGKHATATTTPKKTDKPKETEKPKITVTPHKTKETEDPDKTKVSKTPEPTKTPKVTKTEVEETEVTRKATLTPVFTLTPTFTLTPRITETSTPKATNTPTITLTVTPTTVITSTYTPTIIFVPSVTPRPTVTGLPTNPPQKSTDVVATPAAIVQPVAYKCFTQSTLISTVKINQRTDLAIISNGNPLIFTGDLKGITDEAHVSPNGCNLIVTYQQDGQSNRDLYLVKFLPSGQVTMVNLTNTSEVDDYNPSWLNDTQYAYISKDVLGMRLMEGTIGGTAKVLQQDYADNSFALSGSQLIAYLHNGSIGFIWVTSLKSMEIVGSFKASHVSWYPAGNKVAYTNGLNIDLMDLENFSSKSLLQGNRDLAFSSDGQHAVVVANDTNQLWTYAVNTSVDLTQGVQITNITTDTFSNPFWWTPGSLQIVLPNSLARLK